MSEAKKPYSELSRLFRDGAASAMKPGDSPTNGSRTSIRRDDDKQLATPAVDLLRPGDRFVSISRLYGSLHRWQLLFVRYWRIVALVVVVVVVPVGFLTFVSTPAYESKARMWLTGKLDLREGRLYTEEVIDYLGTQAELLRSPLVQRRALARLGAPIPPSSAAPKGDSPMRLEVTNQEKNSGNSLSESNRIASGGANPPFPYKVKVVEARKSSILELRAIGPKPVATRDFLNYLMEEYLRFKKESREKTSDRTMTSVATQVTELAKELETQQEKLHAFQSSNNIVFLQEQGNSAGNYLALLNKRLAGLRTELRLLRSLQPEQWVETKTGREAAPSIDSVADEATAKEILASLAGPQLELFKANQQMQLLNAKRDELSRFLRPLHPKIIKLNEEIKTQEKVAQIVRDEAVKQMTHRRQAIELEIQNLDAEFVEWDAKAIQASRKMADYDRIRQDLQRLQSAYEKMQTLMQTVDVSKTVEQENVGILEAASQAVPTRRMLRNVAMAVAASLLVGFGLLYGIGLFHDDFASVAELAGHLSEKVVGQIPAVSIRKPEHGPGIETLEKQSFEFQEAFRSIRSWFLVMNNGGPKAQTVLVASSVPEEGKSTVALFLAATLAKGNSRVLLIDADMRRATLHQFFGVASCPGLAEILDGRISSKEAIVPTGLENLALLPAGEANRNPGELALSSEWSRFLADARRRYDYILVDTPPLLATEDAATLALKVDGVLFVVRGSFTSGRMARRALDVLRQRRVHVLGLVFNRAASSPYEDQGYQRYCQAYGWEPRETRSADALAGKA
jgi:polysaccharide biosynthesis transport protein